MLSAISLPLDWLTSWLLDGTGPMAHFAIPTALFFAAATILAGYFVTMPNGLPIGQPRGFYFTAMSLIPASIIVSSTLILMIMFGPPGKWLAWWVAL
jgi:hypothetical protein